MENAITVRVKTLSNLLIGGVPTPFEIGGIDQKTAVDAEGYPCIPASTMKGALRAIVHQNHKSELGQRIAALYENYIKREAENNRDRISQWVEDREELKRIEVRYQKAYQESTPEYLFGIEGFNGTPKLLFSDLILRDKPDNMGSCFSIDMKNSIAIVNQLPVSNPRSYKTARSGLEFTGEIHLYRIGLLGESAVELCKEYIQFNLEQFNDGVHRLGNSKSRGYGKISVSVLAESEARAK